MVHHQDLGSRVPHHVAIIMDGNRRWAAKRGLGPVDGHRYAAEKTIESIVRHAIKRGVKYLTFWAFSTENKNRDKSEIRGLLNIFRDALKTGLRRLYEMGVRINVIGDISWFPKDIAKGSIEFVKRTRGNKRITVTFAINYGGRQEILEAANRLINALKNSKRFPKKITEKEFNKYLYTNGTPDPDLVIRTGGEKRLSGYLPWQSVYSELYFTKTLWPDFTPSKFDKALADFAKRTRRFGGGKFKDYKKVTRNIAAYTNLKFKIKN